MHQHHFYGYCVAKMTEKTTDFNLHKLNAVRIFIVLMIALGYASTMPIGPGETEKLAHLGYDPSWIGISLLFFISGIMAMRSLNRHGSIKKYLISRAGRNLPLLAFVTLISVLVIYPLFGVSSDSLGDTVKKLGVYFLGTVSCLRPGEPLPGLLDDAKYMCLIQGAIWTLKWGLIAHIAASLGHFFGFFKNKRLTLFITLSAIFCHFTMQYYYVNGGDVPDNLMLAARLGWPFLAGMSVFAWRDKLPKSVRTNMAITIAFFATAVIWFSFLQWSPVIEILLTCAWSWMAFTILSLKTDQMKMLNNWPALALAIYLLNWPVSQMLLLALPEITSWQLIALSLPVTLILSSGAHKLVSARSYDWTKRLIEPTPQLKAG